MSPGLKQFIQNNRDLINQNSKESWEEIYNKIPYKIVGEFTQTILDAGINDPASIMGYIPDHYLFISKIANYKIPDSVTSIGNYAFCNCDSLASVKIPDSVTTIGSHAFYSCDSLTSVVIGNGVNSIGYWAFEGCSSLKEINFKGTKEQAIQLGIGNSSEKEWRENSSIGKIICTDGEIIL